MALVSASLFDNISCTVEIGFSTTAGTNTVPLGGLISDIVWTDVTAYVRGLSWQRGRSTELDSFQAGSASVVLSNADRRFDPLYASSPYFGALTPMRPIQITVSHRDDFGSTNIYPVFFGYINGWPQTYETYGDATVTISASDASSVLNQLTLPGIWEDTIASESPLVWLRFNDGDTQRITNEGSDGSVWWWADTRNFTLTRVQGSSVDGLIVDDSNKAGKFAPGFQAFSGTWSEEMPSTDYAVEFWVKAEQTGSESSTLVNLGQQKNGVAAQLVTYLGYGVVVAYIGDCLSLGSTFDIYTSDVLINDGNAHHVVLNYGTTPGLFVDGVEATKTSSNVATGTYVGSGFVGGNSPFNDTYSSTTAFLGTIDEFLIWDQNLSAATIADHLSMGNGTIGTGERTDERITRILDLIDWPTDGRTLSTGLSTVQGARTQGKTALAALQECEAAEQGMVFAGVLGEIVFRTRDDFARLVDAATFGDSTGEIGYQDIVIEQLDKDIANQVTVSRNDGGSSTSNDTTSQGQYFVRTLEVTDLIVDTDEFCNQLARDLLRRYKAPQTRIRSLSGTVRGRSSADIETILALDISNRVTVKRRPQNVGSAINQSLQIQSVNGEIGTDNMVMSFDLAPAPTQFFVLDDSTNGVLGSSRLGL